mgnify:FL=1
MRKQLDSLYAIALLGILIHERKEGDFLGEILEQYSETRTPFFSTMDLIKKIEAFYEEWYYPESSTRDRSFQKKQKFVYPDRRGKKPLSEADRDLRKFPITKERGRLGSFFVHTKFRQNASWQGDVYHGEDGTCYSFSSLLSLLQIMERECGE